MMSYLRKNMKVILILVIIFFVAFIFLQWGLNITSGNTLKQDGRYIGEVAGMKITRDAYASRINEIRREYMASSGKTSINQQDEQYIEEEAFNSIVDDIIFSRIEEKYGYFATNEEITDIIMNVPPQEARNIEQFYVDGQFSMDMYRQFATNPSNREFYVQYYRQIANQLPKLKMQTDLISGITVNQDEIMRELRLNESRFNIEYIVVPNTYDKEIALTEDEMMSYFENNKGSFYQNPSAVIKIIMLNKEPSAQDVLLAKENIEGLRSDIVAGNIDFETAAAMYSDDYQSARNNGSIGFIKQGETVTEFNDAAFSLRKGEISQPVKTMFGWHIIRCNAIRSDSIDVSHILVRISPSYETVQAIMDNAQGILKHIRENGFDAGATNAGLDVITTQPFNYEKPYIFEINANAPRIGAFISNSRQGDVSGIINEQDFLAIVRIEEKTEKGIPTFEQVEDIVRNRMIREKKRVLSSMNLNGIVRTINDNNTSLRTYAASNDYEYVKTGLITLQEKMQFVPENSRLLGGILVAEDDGVYYVSDYDNGYIFRVIDREEVNISQSQELIDKYQQILINERQQALLKNWAATVTDVYKVKDLRY